MPSKHTRGSGLRRLSDTCLLSRLDELAVRELRITLCLIEHLCEIDRRRLYLEEGYRSMFAYCTRRLGYSASAASRRIRTARCVRRFPRVHSLLERNRVNLTTVSIVAGILTDENHASVLHRIEGRTQDDVEKIAMEYKPRGQVRDQIKPVCVRPRPASGHFAAVPPTLGCGHDRNGRGTPGVTSPRRVPGSRSA